MHPPTGLYGLRLALLGRHREALTAEVVERWRTGVLASHRIVGIGIAVPGLVRSADGLVRRAPHLDWTDAPLRTLRLTHGGDNAAACRVAEKSGFALDRELAPRLPRHPLTGHVHTRKL